MNKVILAVLFIFFLTICKAQHKDIEKPNIVFRYDESMEIDFSAKTIKLVHKDHFKIPYAIHFTNKEESEIARSFAKNQIAKVRGNITCFNDKIAVAPSSDCKVELLQKGKVYATILVDYYYDPKTVRKHDSNYRAGNFVIDVTKILEHNSDFKIALDSLRSYEKRNHIFKL